MLNLNSLVGASTSSHVTSGLLTPHLQSVRSSYVKEDSDLLDQGASNAFPPFHYWKPYPIEQCIDYPTVNLNFYRYLPCKSRKCQSIIANGIRTVFITNQYALKGFKVFDSLWE